MGFQFQTDELTITLGGVLLDLGGTFTVSCNADGLIEGIDWDGGTLLDDPDDIDRARRALFLALERAITAKNKDTIAVGVAELGAARLANADPYNRHLMEMGL